MNPRDTTRLGALLVGFLLAAPAVPHDPPEAGCDPAPAEMAREIALMRSRAQPMPESVLSTRLPCLSLNKHYALALKAQADVGFRAPPGRTARSSTARAGMYCFRVSVAGRYRVSITSRHWIDIVDGGTVVPSVSHHRPGCGLVHKTVEFDLPSGKPLTLQLSGQDDSVVGLAITYVET